MDAVLLGISDGKVQLHKSNGVKISVKLDKLSEGDMDYLMTLPGNENLVVGAGKAAAVAPRVSAVQGSGGVANDACGEWTAWLLRCGVPANDAARYAETFSQQNLDVSLIKDIDRDVLRTLKVSEGDIIRIKKQANLPVVSDAVMGRIKGSEGQAQLANLQMLGRGDQMSKERIREQMLKDEALARELQSREGRGSVLTPMSGGVVDAQVLKRAATSLKAGSDKPPAFDFGGQGGFSSDPWGGPQSSSGNSDAASEQAQRTLQEAQQRIQRAQEQARQAQMLESQTQQMKMQQLESEKALEKANETARRAMAMQQQAEQALLKAQMNAQQQQQQGISRAGTVSGYQQPPPMPSLAARLPIPLVPTPSANSQSHGGFVPTNQMPGMNNPAMSSNMNARNSAYAQQGQAQWSNQFGGGSMTQASNNIQQMQSAGGGMNSSDPYSAFRDVNPQAPSLFNAARGAAQMNPTMTGGSGSTAFSTAGVGAGLRSNGSLGGGSQFGSNSGLNNIPSMGISMPQQQQMQQQRPTDFRGVGMATMPISTTHVQQTNFTGTAQSQFSPFGQQNQQGFCGQPFAQSSNLYMSNTNTTSGMGMMGGGMPNMNSQMIPGGFSSMQNTNSGMSGNMQNSSSSGMGGNMNMNTMNQQRQGAPMTLQQQQQMLQQQQQQQYMMQNRR